MGGVLQRGAFSPNIKERRDFSTAIFDARGRLAAQGRNIPVHLGSMFSAVEAALAECGRLEPGDVVLLNDPYRGGTHLPDLTVIAPYYRRQPSGLPERASLCYFAARAHHSDIGGISGGSLGLASEVYQEGLVIPPVRLVRAGEVQHDLLAMLLANSRTPHERRGDLAAQLAALRRGAERMDALAADTSSADWQGVFEGLQAYSARAVEELLGQVGGGSAQAACTLEIPNVPAAEARIAVRLAVEDATLVADFRGSSPQHRGPFNAVRAVTTAAVFYTLRCLLPPETPTNHGLLDRVRILTEPGSIVDARPPAAVNAANVETSQRLVELLLRAWARLLPGRIPASSQGTMNNLLISGTDPRPGRRQGRAFTYYETIAGGHGGHPEGPGLSGRHSHMTNTLNTPVEALERAYPLRVDRYAIRKGSGGAGRHGGGYGVVREIRLLTGAEVTVVSQHRADGPPGLRGGAAGLPGRNSLRQGGRRRATPLAATATVPCGAGAVVCVETPGGGGWGRVT